MLTLALKQIPMNVAYAIWLGLGTLMVVLIGMVFFHDNGLAAEAGIHSAHHLGRDWGAAWSGT